MSTERDFDAIVIGSGPAGMMAAGRSGERRKKTLLIEKNDILGKKLLISGKGRCNITNAGDVNEYLDNFGKSGQFLRNAFSRIFNTELMDFFEKRGVTLKIEKGKRVFPESGRSKDILNALKKYLQCGSVKVLLNSEVEDIVINSNALKKITLSKGSEYISESVAICTGGLSYPQTGSTGFGFKMAKRIGHNVIPAKPALVPITTDSDLPRMWQGLSLRNIEATVVSNGKRRATRFGDAIFTHFGLSGPIILDLSAEIFDLLRLKKEVFLSLNLKPALDKGTLDNRLLREFSGNPKKMLKNILNNLLPGKMIDGFIKNCRIPPNKKANQMTKEERKCLIDKLTDLRFRVKEVRPLEEAIVTRGGIDTKEIDPKTMESRLVKGLFFAGEVIDIDAKTGGYNMQAAFSTGCLCGDNL